MRVGKSDAVRCDFCGEVVAGEPDIIRTDGDEVHFCNRTCLDEYLFEHYCRDKIEEAVEPRVKEEFKLIHKQVCPACKYRLQKLL